MNCEKCTAPETNCEYWVGTHCALDDSFSYGFEIGEHYFIPLSPAQRICGIVLTGSGDEVYTECAVKPYIFDGIKYKWRLVPLDNDNFCSREFYSSDFSDMIKCGWAIKKERETQHVEVWKGAEQIEGTSAIVIHEGTWVVG